MPVVLSLTLFIAILMSLSRATGIPEMVVWFSSGCPHGLGAAGAALCAAGGGADRRAVPLGAPWAQKKSVDTRSS